MDLQKRIKELESENMTLYACILEASNLGINASGRCKLELQRIVGKDAEQSTQADKQ